MLITVAAKQVSCFSIYKYMHTYISICTTIYIGDSCVIFGLILGVSLFLFYNSYCFRWLKSIYKCNSLCKHINTNVKLDYTHFDHAS